MDGQLDADAKSMIKDIIRREGNAKDAFARVKDQIKDDIKALASSNGVPVSKINAIIAAVRGEMQNTGALDAQRELINLAEEVVNS